MKRTGTSRLLRPKDMELLVILADSRDDGCIVCHDHMKLDAHHILPQRIIKDEYGNRGGKIVDEDEGTYAPITRFEFWLEPDVDAYDVAIDPDTVVALCREHHDQAEADHSFLLDCEAGTTIHSRLVELGKKYSVAHRIERYYGRVLA